MGDSELVLITNYWFQHRKWSLLGSAPFCAGDVWYVSQSIFMSTGSTCVLQRVSLKEVITGPFGKHKKHSSHFDHQALVKKLMTEREINKWKADLEVTEKKRNIHPPYLTTGGMGRAFQNSLFHIPLLIKQAHVWLSSSILSGFSLKPHFIFLSWKKRELVLFPKSLGVYCWEPGKVSRESSQCIQWTEHRTKTPSWPSSVLSLSESRLFLLSSENASKFLKFSNKNAL